MTSVFHIINEMHEHLSSLTGVCDVKTNMQLPADRLSISEWEKKFNCSIPADLLDFYLVTNGLSVSWKIKCGEIKCSVGKININSLTNLVCIVGSSDSQEAKISFSDLLVKVENSDLKTTVKVPNLVNQSCRLFHLEECDYETHVLLVYFENKSGIYSKNPEIWLLDRSYRFYKLASSFSEYFRLLITHFGLPQWQLLFTDYGPTPQAKQFINLYASARLDIKNDLTGLPQSMNHVDTSLCKKPNFDKIFKIVESKLTVKTNKNPPAKSAVNK